MMYLQNSITTEVTGDGTNTSVVIDLKAIPDAAWIGGLPKDTPLAIWGSVSVGSNYQSITVSSATLTGNLLTVNFSSAPSVGNALTLYAYFTFPTE